MAARIDILQNIFLIILAIASSSSFAADQIQIPEHCRESLSKEERLLLGEFAAAYSKLEDGYKNCTMTANGEIYRAKVNKDLIFESPLQVQHTEQWKYKALEGDYFLLEGGRHTIPQEASTERTQVALLRPDESYLFNLDPVTEKYVLEAHGKETEKYLLELRLYRFFLAPYSYDTIPLKELLFSADTAAKIQSVTASSDPEGTRHLVITRTLTRTCRG